VIRVTIKQVRIQESSIGLRNQVGECGERVRIGRRKRDAGQPQEGNALEVIALRGLLRESTLEPGPKRIVILAEKHACRGMPSADPTRGA
jgi:hypothetical protein